MAIETTRCTRKLTLSGVIRSLNNLLDNYYQNSYQSPLDALNQFVGEVSQILTDRCCYIYKKGKNKNMKCLRARLANTGGDYIGDKCGGHSSKELKKEPKKTTIRKQPNPDSAPVDPLKNTSHTVENFQVDIVDWGKPSVASKPKFLTKEYYSNTSDLTFLYEDLYLDRTGTIAQRNFDIASDYKWILIKKYSKDNKGLIPFTDTVLEELKKQKRTQGYNYIIDESITIDLKKVIRAVNEKQEKTPDQTPKSIVQAPPKLTLQTEAEKIDKFRAYTRAPKVVIYEDDYMDSTELAQLTRKQEAEKARIQAEKERDRTARLVELEKSEKGSVESVSDASLGSEEFLTKLNMEHVLKTKEMLKCRYLRQQNSL